MFKNEREPMRGGRRRGWRHHWHRHPICRLLQVDYAAAAKDRRYRCLDLPPVHKNDPFTHLHQKWQDLFHASSPPRIYAAQLSAAAREFAAPVSGFTASSTYP